MAAPNVYQLIFNCTPAQFATAMATTLPAVGFAVTQAPVKFQGLLIGTAAGTGAANGMGQIDFSYDGAYYLRFYGANPAPVGMQANAGIPQVQMSSQLIAELTTALAGTLGAPVPSNQANVPGPAA